MKHSFSGTGYATASCIYCGIDANIEGVKKMECIPVGPGILRLEKYNNFKENEDAKKRFKEMLSPKVNIVGKVETDFLGFLMINSNEINKIKEKIENSSGFSIEYNWKSKKIIVSGRYRTSNVCDWFELYVTEEKEVN